MWPVGGGGGVGGTVEVGEPMAGLPPPPPLFGKTTGLGLVAGGRSSLKEGTDEERAEEEREGDVAEGRGLRGWLLAGRKEEGTSLAEEALRWSGWACEEPPSPSRNRREWSGLEGSEAPPPPPPPPPTPFSCSSVSRTTSGVWVCLEVLCLSSLLSSLRAEVMVASMSCELCSTWAMTSGSSGLWLLKLLERPAVVVLRNCGLSTLVLREEWRVTELRML